MPNKPVLGVLVLGGILGGGYAAWDSTINHEFFPRNFGVIIEGQAYRSGRLTPGVMRKVVEERGIRTILDLGAFIEGSPKDLEQQRVADELGVVRFRMPNLIGDGTGNPNEFAHAVRMLSIGAASWIAHFEASGGKDSGREPGLALADAIPPGAIVWSEGMVEARPETLW